MGDALKPIFSLTLNLLYMFGFPRQLARCVLCQVPCEGMWHYRSVLMPSDGVLKQSLHTDDNATARKVKSSELVGIKRNAYIVFLQRAD